MKSIVRTLALMSLAAVFSLTSCKKYDDGPGFSLRTKTQRLVGDWQLQELEVEGTDYTSDINRWEVEFEKGGDFTESFQIEGFNSSTTQGEWSFSNDKEELELKYDDGDRLDLKIKRLTNKEFWFEFTVDYDDGTSELWEVKLESK